MPSNSKPGCIYKKTGAFYSVAHPTFEAFALPLHWISNDKKAHAREICIYQLPTQHGCRGGDTIHQRRHLKRCIIFNAEKLRSFRKSKITTL